MPLCAVPNIRGGALKKTRHLSNKQKKYDTFKYRIFIYIEYKDKSGKFFERVFSVTLFVNSLFKWL